MMMMKLWSTLGAAALLGGCASMRSLDSDVSTFSQWPADRKPSSYAFERLPSQQARPQQQQVLEDSARRAVEGAGFVPAADPKTAEVSVQIGARITPAERSPFDDPFWFGAGRGPFGYGYGYGYGFRGRYWGGGWGGGLGYGWYGGGYDFPTYDREVGVLIRDRKSGLALYEASATSTGMSSSAPLLLPSMFAAALRDFPNSVSESHRVRVELTP